MRGTGFQLTLGHAAVAIAASVLTIAFLKWPALFWLLVIVLTLLLAIWVSAHLILHGFTSIRCPACGAWGLERVAIRSFGFRYFRCRTCETRCKRSLIGLWYDASGKSDVAMFARMHSPDPWGDGPITDPEAGKATTQGILLRSKQLRNPSHGADTLD
jgi:hypothetical protein